MLFIYLHLTDVFALDNAQQEFGRVVTDGSPSIGSRWVSLDHGRRRPQHCPLILRRLVLSSGGQT